MRSIENAFHRIKQQKPYRSGSATREILVCNDVELKEGGRQIVDTGKFTVGVFRVSGKLYGIRNYCPHNGAELCKGTLHSVYEPNSEFRVAKNVEGLVLTCPWHGRQFDLRTGYGLFDEKSKVPTYQVIVRDGRILLKV